MGVPLDVLSSLHTYMTDIVDGCHGAASRLKNRKNDIGEIQSLWQSVPLAARGCLAASAIYDDLVQRFDEQAHLEEELVDHVLGSLLRRFAQVGVEPGFVEGKALCESMRNRMEMCFR